MTPDDLARIHADSFVRARPWGASEFQSLLADPASFLITCDTGFILGRTMLDEAELLTLAVEPAARRLGTGRNLLTAFEDAARMRGAATAFLEVACDNQAALSLYARAGWQNAGRRRNYYGGDVDALVMRKHL